MTNSALSEKAIPDSETSDASQDSDLIKKLKSKKLAAAAKGDESTTLPVSDVKVTWPSFKPHHLWSKATRLAKKSPMSVTDFYITMLCKFDGENLTIKEYREFLSTDDILHLASEVMGDADDAEEAGNAPGQAQA